MPCNAPDGSNLRLTNLSARVSLPPALRAAETNPPTNPELLEALAKDLIAHQYDVKHLIRLVMNSAAYQRSSRPARRPARVPSGSVQYCQSMRSYSRVARPSNSESRKKAAAQTETGKARSPARHRKAG